MQLEIPKPCLKETRKLIGINRMENPDYRLAVSRSNAVLTCEIKQSDTSLLYFRLSSIFNVAFFKGLLNFRNQQLALKLVLS